MLRICVIFHKPTTTELRIVLWDDIGVYEPYNLSSCARNEACFLVMRMRIGKMSIVTYSAKGKPEMSYTVNTEIENYSSLSI